MRRTLFGQVFVAIVASHITLTLVLSGVFVFAVQRSVERWNVDQREESAALLVPEIRGVYRRTGRLAEAALREALTPFLIPTLAVTILNRQNEPVFIYDNGNHISVLDPAHQSVGAGRPTATTRPPVPVVDNGQVIAYVSVVGSPFRADLTNRTLLQTLFRIVLVGTVATVVGALAASIALSRRLVRPVAAVAAGLSEIAAGRRNVTFAQAGPLEMRSLAQSAEALQIELSHAERLRNRWMQDVSHDLRTPITALHTQLEGIASGYLAATPARLQALTREVQLIVRLVNDMRELSQMESPEIVIERERIVLDALLAAVAQRFAALATERGVTIDAIASGIEVIADGHLLERALANVVDNAIGHAAADSTVHIAGRRRPGAVEITVANQGSIDSADVPHVFERFFRGHGAEERRGSGLGLAIVAAIIGAHDGTVALVQEGDHTVVRMILPNHSSDAAATTPTNR